MSEAAIEARRSALTLFASRFGRGDGALVREARALRVAALARTLPAGDEPTQSDNDEQSEENEQIEKNEQSERGGASRALVVGERPAKRAKAGGPSQALSRVRHEANAASALHAALEAERPAWRAPWTLMRVVAGHTGWVRCVAVDVSNEWFATGAADRTVKVWDLASGRLKVTLTGHIGTVRGVAISARSPYMFSVGDDKMVKLWDLETNTVTRQYHGHLSGVYSCALHPSLDVLVTGGRDATARVWDIRTQRCAHVLTGHRDTVWSVAAQDAEPQIITGSADSTVRLWDLAAGKCRAELTHHKRSVRSLAINPNEYTFATGSTGSVKVFLCPDGRLMRNMRSHNAIINTLACNGDVLFSGGDNGSMCWYDYKSGYCYQRGQAVVQPGSLTSEAGIFASAFDRTGTRLITCEADKTIKTWKQDDEATELTHPIDKDWRRQVRDTVSF